MTPITERYAICILVGICILVCGGRREETQDNRAIEVGEGINAQYLCGNQQFHDAVKHFQEEVKKQTNTQLALLKSATSVYTIGQQALKTLDDETVTVEREKITKESTFKSVKTEVEILEKEVKQAQEEKSDREMIMEMWERMNNPFGDEKTRRPTKTYYGCLDLDETTWVKETAKSIKGLEGINKNREFSIGEFFEVCVSKSMEILRNDGELTEEDEDTMNRLLRQTGDQVEDEIDALVDESMTSGLDCVRKCQEYAKEIDKEDNDVFKQSAIYKLTEKRKKVETEFTEITQRYENYKSLAPACKMGLENIQTHSDIIGEFSTHQKKLNKELDKLHRQAKDNNEEIYEITETLEKTNVRRVQLDKECKDKDAFFQNISCEETRLARAVVVVKQKVTSIQKTLTEERERHLTMEEAKKVYFEMKLKLQSLIEAWSMNILQKIEVVQTMEMTSHVSLYEHNVLVTSCNTMEEAFESLNGRLNFGTEAGFPLMCTDMYGSIATNSRPEDSKGKILQENIINSFRTYAASAFKTEKQTYTSDIDIFQTTLMKLLVYCPMDGDPSFCNSFLLGWLDPQTCANSAICISPCQKAEGETCRHPHNQEHAGKYLLDGRFKSMIQGQLVTVEDVTVQLTKETTILLKLENELKDLETKVKQHKTAATKCKDEFTKLVHEIETVHKETEKKLQENKKEIQSRTRELKKEVNEYGKHGLQQMKYIHAITSAMVTHHIKPEEAMTAFTKISEETTYQEMKEKTTFYLNKVNKAKKRL